MLDTITMLAKYRNASNGMLNIFELQGTFLGFNSENKTLKMMTHPSDDRYSVNIVIRNKTIPKNIHVGETIRVNGFIRGGEEHISLRALTISDCLDLAYFGGEAEKQWREKTGYRVDDAAYHAIRLSRKDNNRVRLQGFVEALLEDPGSISEDGNMKTPPCLHIMLRQFDQQHLNVPVRLYGNSEKVRNASQRLQKLFNESMKAGRRIPIDVTGQVFVEIKDVEKVDSENKKILDSDGNPILEESIKPIVKVFNLRLLRPEVLAHFMPGESSKDGKKGERIDPYPWAGADSDYWTNKSEKAL